MKKFLLSTVALAGLTAGAVAADLPMRAAPVAVAPAFTWTGFYVGANVGSGWRNDRDNFFRDPGLVTLDRNGAAGIVPSFPQPVVPAAGGFFGQGFGNGTTPLAGLLGGVQAGYNWQVTPGHGWVLGVEGDIQVSDIGRRRNNDNGGFLGTGFGAFGTPGFGTGFGGFQAAAVSPAGLAGPGFGVSAATAAATPNNIALFNNFGGNGFNNRNRSGGDWFGTARVRVGYAVDRIMFYGTGGLAFADDNRNNNNGVGFNGFGTGFANGAAVVAAAPAFFTSAAAVTAAGGVIPTNGGLFVGNRNNSNGNIGAAVGAGVEYAWTNNLSIKFEGMGLLFGNRSNNNNNAFAFGNQVVGVTNNGAPITATNTFNTGGRRGTSSSDIWLLRTGLNYRFGLF
jgi:outer membrane immunogenic protein